MTARYNGLFWAKENIKEGTFKIERGNIDDFNKLIPLFVYGDEKLVKTNVSHFDKAIEKTSHVINYHSMLIKGKEYCKWIDENYLVLAQGHFYKKEYFQAIEIFEYIVKQYPYSPTKYKALLWLIRTYNVQLRIINTQAIIDLLSNDKAFPESLAGEFLLLQADYHILTSNYEKAIPFLVKGIGNEKNKRKRSRYLFVLAQLYELTSDLKNASRFYAQCAKSNPPYELFLNARIKRALCAQGSDSKTVKKELNKMLKDEKNKEHRDQLYYALADLSIREGDTANGLQLLKLSAQSSMQNVTQRGISYVRAADIYFNQTDYKYAEAYYDSASKFLPKDYKDFEVVINKKKSLSGLVKNLNTISREDSLLKIAALDTAKRFKIIDAIIAKLVEEEKKKEEEKQNNASNQNANFANTSNSNNLNGNNTAGGAWYFYNPTAMSFGMSDFIKKWGPRSLEDNWRRNNKEQILDITNEEQVQNPIKDTATKGNTIAANKKREYYLKDLPLTKEQKIKSNEKIIEAYNSLGSIYREQLKNYPKSIDAFEELNKRYPENKYFLQNVYQLYRIHVAIKEQKKAEYYKQQIISKYPESEYAKIILNPDFAKDKKATQSLVEGYYNEVYALYLKQAYFDVISKCATADTQFSGNELLPKFALLNAYAIGKTQPANAFENALNKIIIKYPKDPAKAKAQELLDQLKKIQTIDTVQTIKPKTDSVVFDFTYNQETEHYFIMVTPKKGFDMNAASIKMSDLNKQFFSLDNLAIQTMLLGIDNQLLVVKSFANAQKAMSYFNSADNEEGLFKPEEKQKITMMIISSENFKLFYKDQLKEKYKLFFQENYLK